MRVLSIGCTTAVLLINIFIIMQQQQSVEAKPFIFKFFVPQAPARTDSSSSSLSSSSSSSSSSTSSFSTGIDFGSFLSSKLNLLTSLLRTGVAGGFNIGFKKFFPNTQVASTRRPYTSTTARTPDVEFETESTTKSIGVRATTPTSVSAPTTTTAAATTTTTTTTTTTRTTTTTESTKRDKTTGSDDLSEPIEDNKVTTEKNSNIRATTQKPENRDSGNKETTLKTNYDSTSTSKATTLKTQNNGYDYTTSKSVADGNNSNKNNNNNGYEYTTSRVTTFKPNNDNGYSSPPAGYNYDNSNQIMSENEISNEIMMINNQYLPAF